MLQKIAEQMSAWIHLFAFKGQMRKRALKSTYLGFGCCDHFAAAAAAWSFWLKLKIIWVWKNITGTYLLLRQMGGNAWLILNLYTISFPTPSMWASLKTICPYLYFFSMSLLQWSASLLLFVFAISCCRLGFPKLVWRHIFKSSFSLRLSLSFYLFSFYLSLFCQLILLSSV